MFDLSIIYLQFQQYLKRKGITLNPQVTQQE